MLEPKLWTRDFFIICLSNFLIGFSFYLVGTSMPFYIVEQFKTDTTTTGLILASYITAALAVRPFSGYLVDRFPRKNVLLISLAFFILIFYGYMQAKILILFLLFRISHGFTWGITTTASSTLAIDVIPSKKRGEGVGFFGLTSTLAMSIGPMLGLFIYEHYPFEYNFYAAITIGLIALLLILTVKPPVRPAVATQAITLDRFILVKAIPIGINLLGIALCYGALFAFAAMYGKQLQVENTGMFFMMMAIGMTASRFFAGKIIDRGYIHQLVLGALGLLALSFIAFGMATSPVLFFATSFFIGIGYGVLSPAFQTLFVNMATPDKRGTANSTYFSFYDLGIGLGMVASGKIASLFDMGTIFICGGALCFAAIGYYLLVTKKLYEKNKIAE